MPCMSQGRDSKKAQFAREAARKQEEKLQEPWGRMARREEAIEEEAKRIDAICR